MIITKELGHKEIINIKELKRKDEILAIRISFNDGSNLEIWDKESGGLEVYYPS